MAKAIISSILEAQLGKYVDGLSGDSLQVGLWSGELVLQNLTLKPHALVELNLPITVVRGTIRRIHVVVPWNQLGSASVQIAVEGVYALVVPNTRLASAEEMHQSKQNQIERQELLRQHERLAKRNNKEGEDEGTFLSRLTERIVDNLKVTLRDVHFRYEDNISNPESPFACGIMIQSFSFHTTDPEGNEVFVDRATKKERFTHKAIKLIRMGAYWDRISPTDTKALLHKRMDGQACMSQMVQSMSEVDEAVTDSREKGRLWILKPCSVDVQLTRNETSDYTKAAKYTVHATVNQIVCGLSREQYEDMLFLDKAFAGRRAIEAHFFHGRCRPIHSVKARPREWWDYTLFLALTRAGRRQARQRKRLGQRLRWSGMKKNGIERREYIEAFRMQLRKATAFDWNSKHGKTIKHFEATYEIDVIMALRNQAETEEEKKKESDARAQAQAASAGWYGYFFGGGGAAATSTAVGSLSEVLTEEGRAELKQAYDDAVVKEKNTAVPADCNLFAVKLHLKRGILSLYQSGHLTPFLTGSLDGSLMVNVRPSNEWDMKFRMQEFRILNGKAADTKFHTFCTLSSSAKLANPSLPCVSFDANMRSVPIAGTSEHQDRLTVRLTAMPIQLMVDPSFLLFLYEFFMSMLPEQQLEKVWSFATSSVSEWMFSEEQEEELIRSAMQQKRMQYDVLVDMNAPVIVVPENLHDPLSSVVVLDLGRFSFKNDSTGVEASTNDDQLHWNVNMSDIQVLLGENGSLDMEHDDQNSKLPRILRDLSLEFSVATLQCGCVAGKKDTVSMTPNVSATANIPRVVIAISEPQLLSLARIHSSVLAQLASSSKSSSSPVPKVQSDAKSEALPIEQGERSAALKKAVSKIEDSLDKVLLTTTLSIGEVVVHLRESAEKDAFVVKITHTSFDLAILSSQYVFQARLQSLLMEDWLHEPTSPFFPLLSTGDAGDNAHLVSLDVTMYPAQNHSDGADREADMVVDVRFNTLEMQWNPSSIALLYQFITSYTSALQQYTALPVEPSAIPSGAQNIVADSGVEQTVSTIPTMVVRASLVQFAVTFNKDNINRQLMRLAVKDANVEYTTQNVFNSRNGQVEVSSGISGTLGNFIGHDLSLSKHCFYEPLVGLDVAMSAPHSPSGRKEALLKFSFTTDPTLGERSILWLDFQPIRLVYYHQQLLELVDFLFEGILGAMFSQTIMNATQLLLKEDESSVIFQVSVRNPTIILPLKMKSADHIKLTAGSLHVEHFPSSVVHFVGDKRKVIEFGDGSGSSAELPAREAIKASFSADFKRISLEDVSIFCGCGGGSADTLDVRYETIIATSISLRVNVEDMVSSTLRLDDSGSCLPRFAIGFRMSDVELLISRKSYLLLVGLVQDNFGAQQLSVDSSIDLATSSKPKLETMPSLRPEVSYSYSRTDLEAVTMQLAFTMSSLRCVLLSDAAQSDSASHQHAILSVVDTVSAARKSGMVEIVSREFVASLNQLRNASPAISISVAQFAVRDTSGHYLGVAADNLTNEDACLDFNHPGTMLVCRKPAAVVYTWDDVGATCNLDVQMDDVSGIVIPEGILSLVDFFVVPPNDAEKAGQPLAQSSPPSPRKSPRRRSLDITGSGGPPKEYDMTVSVGARGVSLVFPCNLSQPQGKQISLGADFNITYKWSPSQKPASSTGEQTDLRFQSSLVVDAKGIELLIRNAERQGCLMTATDATPLPDCGPSEHVRAMVQIIEPCDLHVEISDLFPHANQKQQIVSLKFTPIEVYASYEDVQIAQETINAVSESVERYTLKKQKAPSQATETDSDVTKAPGGGGVLSPKVFENAEDDLNLEIHRWFTCDVEAMSLTLINDCDGCDMGLLQLHMRKCNLFLNVNYAPTPPSAAFAPPSTTISGNGTFVTLMSYYNPDTRLWHPMCSEWSLDLSVQGTIHGHSTVKSGSNEMHAILTANQPLDLIVTHGLLEMIASAGGAWNRALGGDALQSPPASPNPGKGSPRASREVIEKKKHAPCVIRNDTGMPIAFWLTSGSNTGRKQVLQHNELADLHYFHTVGKGSGVVRQYTMQERSDTMRLCVDLPDSGFQPVQGIVFEQLGSRAFPLTSSGGGSSKYALNCYAKLLEGRILVSISSQVKVVNRMSMPVQLLVNDPSWAAPVEIGVLNPRRETAIPLLLSLGTELRVRPMDSHFSWSAPIPVQTRSAGELKVEASSNGNSDVPSAIFCVTMAVEQSLRVVCFSEPIVLVNKLPVRVTYRVRSPLASGGAKTAKGDTLNVGAKSGIWWSDFQQRPQLKIAVEGCGSKWIDLAHAGNKTSEVFSVMLQRLDGRSFKLLIQIVEHAAKSMHIFLYAEIWFINRTGLELIYGNESDSESYVPPGSARSLVGNAQICAFSSATESTGASAPDVRICMGGCGWSSRFSADPRRLSWQDECLTIRSERRGSSATTGSNMLYEFGISADYATRHFGSITTLISVIPRYLVLNQTQHTVLLVEESLRDSFSSNEAHHILARGDVYALYWVGGARSRLRASIIGEGEFAWTESFSVDQLKTTELLVPGQRIKSQSTSVCLQVHVKKGTISQASIVVVITEVPVEDMFTATTQAAELERPSHGWDRVRLDSQIAGVVVTVADKKDESGKTSPAAPNRRVSSFNNLFGSSNASAKDKATAKVEVGNEEVNENVARLSISRIGLEFEKTVAHTEVKFNVMGIRIEDLLANSKDPIVLRPVSRADSFASRSASSADKYFLEVSYYEKAHAKLKWIERLQVELQDVRVTTSMRFVDCVDRMIKDTMTHFQSHSYSSLSLAATSAVVDLETDENILEYFVHSQADDDGSMASITGRKVYIESFEILPVRVVVSFSREKGDVRNDPNASFWLSNLKFKIENACLTLDEYRLNKAMATQEALIESLATFYEKSVKSQALGLIESIQVTSLVTSMVTGGVSSLVTTILGKTDSRLESSSNFQYEFLSNSQIVAKHSKELQECRSTAQFLQQVKHLVYDWDSNHTGLEARGCVALGILNNSRHSLVVNAHLNDGAEIRVLPLGRKSLASLSGSSSGAASFSDGGASEWRSDRSMVIFAWGYTPTLLTSGDVYFTVQSNACNIFVTRKTARLKANIGYTAAFTHQEVQNWWATNVVIVGDDIQVHTPETPSSAGPALTGAANPLFPSAPTPTAPLLKNGNSVIDEEYEIVFHSQALGIVAKQSGASVIVRECACLPSGEPGPALATGQIENGDVILSVNGIRVTTTNQFRDLVVHSPRPLVLRFQRFAERYNAAYDLFGESTSSSSGGGRSQPAPARGSSSSNAGFDLFGTGS